jgi:hypothetical protein
MEIKIMLSTPKTISKNVRVIKAKRRIKNAISQQSVHIIEK